MAQRFSILKAPINIDLIIGGNDLCLFEFQDFFERVEEELAIKIDGYSGGGIGWNKNRELAQRITQQMYRIEDSFPLTKPSVHDKRKQISKAVAMRFFQVLLELLERAYTINCDIGIEGE
ncbi:MAG: hypothetical protein P1U56_05810 [Saprospiraceae bacterium]|nr:hypothetical protein [Saprospiraceae bacterium]